MPRTTKRLFSERTDRARTGEASAGGAGDQTQQIDPVREASAPSASECAAPLVDLNRTELIRDDPDVGSTIRIDAGTSEAASLRWCSQCGSRFSSPDVRFCPFDGQLVDETDWDPTGDPLIGKTIAERYLVEAVLAEGSMGTVYRVRHTRLQTAFAMKVLRRDLAREEAIASRITDEARATAAIGHPNIVAVTDFGEIDHNVLPELRDLRLPYFIMELLAGRTLAELIRDEAPLDTRRVVGIALQLASALGAAHDVGIVHRDLKPANVRLSQGERGAEIAKVVDFGVAKIMGRSRKTQVGVVFGTPHYMSPEQGRGQPIDRRTDIYALGVILYECLAGRVPFEADTYMGVVTKHQFARPDPLELPAKDEAAARLREVLLRCLAKDPADRFQTMGELAEQLERVLDGSTSELPRGRRLELRESSPPPELDPMLADAARTPYLGPLILGGLIVLGFIGYLFCYHVTPQTVEEQNPSSILPAPATARPPSFDASTTTWAASSEPSAPTSAPPPRVPPPNHQRPNPPPPSAVTPTRPGPKGKGDVVDPWSD